MGQNQPRQPTPEVMNDIRRLICTIERGQVVITVFNGGVTKIDKVQTLDIAHLGDLHNR